MKIGYVLTNLLLGGVQTFLADLAAEISKTHEVKYSVISMDNADPFVIERFGNIPRVSLKELVEWSDIINLDGMISKHDMGMFKVKWNRTVETFASARNFSLISRLFRYNIPPYLVAMSKYIGNSLKLKHRIICCGVDTDKFKPLNIKKKYDLVMIGRMRPIKNYALFLEICQKGNFSFLTIGGTHRRLSGHVNEIEKMVRGQAIEGRDYVPGFVPNEDVVPLLNQARIAVVTSHSEALGYNSLQPMACGVPAIARRVGGTPEVLGESSDLLVPYDAPAEVYIEKIKRYIDDAETGKIARQRIIEKFSLKKSVEDYNNMYQGIMTEHG